MEELQAFDPHKVQRRHNITEVVALETSITDALGASFGHGTPRFNLYKDAAKLDQGPRIMRLGTPFGDGQANRDAQDAHEARRYLTEGKERSLQLLQRAIVTLEDEIADQSPQDQALVSTPGVAPASSSSKVFVVHGHSGVEHAVAGFLRKLGLEPVILHEKPNEGRTIIEKFEAYSDVDFAVVLITADDVGGLRDCPQHPRARQNVILELGYFVGRLGRKKVCPLIEGDVELPSDVLGVGWVELDKHEGWHLKLAKELQAAGYEFDLNKAISG
jgi:predicted nucleotide-binding protein